MFWVRACAQVAQRAGLRDEQHGGGAAPFGLGEHRACPDVDAADEGNLHSLRQRPRPVRDDDLAFDVDARKRVDVPAGHRPAVPDIDDGTLAGDRTGKRAHHEVVAEAKAPAVDLDRRRRRIDLRLAHRVVLQERAVVARRFEARLAQPPHDVPRRAIEPGRRRVAALELVGRQVLEIAGKPLGGDPLGGLANRVRQARRLGLQHDTAEQREDNQTLLHMQ